MVLLSQMVIGVGFGFIFQHAIDSVSSLLIISTNVTSMLVPAAMGLLIPALGINWVMALPALCCAFAVLPMQLSNRVQASGANRPS